MAFCGCSSTAAPQRDPLLLQKVPDTAVVTTASVPRLGRILVDGAHHALYMFPPDAGSQVRCTGGCAATWPPLVIAAHHQPQAGPGVNASDLGTLADPN